MSDSSTQGQSQCPACGEYWTIRHSCKPMSDSKPREWWINPEESWVATKLQYADGFVHVIEKSAYDALAAEFQANRQCVNASMSSGERNALTAQLEAAIANEAYCAKRIAELEADRTLVTLSFIKESETSARYRAALGYIANHVFESEDSLVDDADNLQTIAIRALEDPK
jgi:hypothetical protein